MEITGGTFADTGLTKEAFSAYTAEGTVVTEGPDGTFTVKELDETNGVAEVGGKYYASLQKAVEQRREGRDGYSAPGYGGDIVIPEGAELTLNLNGKTLTNHEDHTITNKGTLTITGGGTVDNVTHARAAIQNEPAAMWCSTEARIPAVKRTDRMPKPAAGIPITTSSTTAPWRSIVEFPSRRKASSLA